jgi:proton-translocating NAD(P)+ transhydrogenase subunit alpha
MIIGILKEPDYDNRVVMLAESVAVLTKLGVQVIVEKDAGLSAYEVDQKYIDIDAKIGTKNDILTKADVILSINTPESSYVDQIKENQVLIGQLNPLFDHDLVKKLSAKGITSFSLDSIPRTTRAQAMDILSSMATIAGYKSVLTAANLLPNFFPMFMSAAGTIKPSKVLILGAGVAGLQSIAIARKLGAVVEAFDVRTAVKEEVESLGAKFVEVEGAKDDAAAGGYAVEQTEEYKQKQQELIQDHSIKADVVICTAQIPGRKAPILIKKETVENMKAGSVIIDLAASTGGNCELTEDEKTIQKHGVTIVGNSNFASEMPNDASKMYGKNVLNFLKLIIDENGNLNLNFEDDIVQGTCITKGNEIINEKVKSLIK